MEIIESTDHFCQDVYRIEDQGHLIAKCYMRKDAEIIKAVLEKAREEESKDSGFW